MIRWGRTAAVAGALTLAATACTGAGDPGATSAPAAADPDGTASEAAEEAPTDAATDPGSTLTSELITTALEPSRILASETVVSSSEAIERILADYDAEAIDEGILITFHVRAHPRRR